ncbi:hypothetical protein RD792_007396 [Penstemon davidsonii]|uniref:NAC domain-containing protein n=1 Tax=Penstemon davidsonii TaxID=160366 RepID=A0ABR0D6C7_9LAMI|nr:hypothetical protein RD792_007396 [Penstemon davidsonii]
MNWCYERQHEDQALPPGFRFHPTDEELITYYLLKKVLECSFTSRAIAEVDLNKCEPWHLPGKAKMGEKEWYFFSLRDRKYPTGLRTNRATEAGYWKATGKDREIYSSKTCSLVGMKKTLVFYRGRAPKGEKSNWVMHEYRLEGKLAYRYLSKSSKDEWVISRVFQKSGAGSSSSSSSASKKRPSTSAEVVSSPSSVTLPPLFEASTDRESCSNAPKDHEHVSCFSTTATAPSSFNHHINSSLFELPPPPPLIMHDPAARFPSLRRSHQDLPPFPFFSSAHVAPPPPMHGGDQLSGLGGHWPAPENQKMAGHTHELDCMWGY